MTNFNIVGDTPNFKSAIIFSGLSVDDAENIINKIHDETNANYRQINQNYENIRIEPIN